MWRVADYHFDLPEQCIAQDPAAQRDESRLLVVAPDSAQCHDRRFRDLVELLPPDAVVVVNDTQVIPARLRARKSSGGAVELLLLEAVDPDRASGPWLAMARSSKPMRVGMDLAIVDSSDNVVAKATVISPRRADGLLEVQLDGDALEVLDRAGAVPLPPYIERQPGGRAEDRDRYQTVYARHRGAVAAPTAGLHFTQSLLDRLAAKGCAIAPLTLHVGLGTFAPVRVESFADHHMHRERYSIPEATADLVTSGRPVVAVGTTVVRALEASARSGGVIPGPASTDLFIGPDFEFRVVDQLVTNFHLPESTLLVLVCAFAGYETTMSAYRQAVSSGYRFYSYGDAMLLSRAHGK